MVFTMGRTSQQNRRATFRTNLQRLLEFQEWTPAQLESHVGIPAAVVRKYLHRGLANLTATNRPGLERLCKRLGIKSIDLLWSKKLEHRRLPEVAGDGEYEGLEFKLCQLVSEFRERPAVDKICRLIDSAYDKVVCDFTEAKERARGQSHIDLNSKRETMDKHRRRKVKNKNLDDE